MDPSVEKLLGLDSTDLLLVGAGQAGVGIDVEIDGAPFDPNARPDCKHAATLNVQTLVAFIRDDRVVEGVTEDGQVIEQRLPGEVTDWQVRIRARCGECGRPFDVDPASARSPRDNPRGAVLRMTPSGA